MNKREAIMSLILNKDLFHKDFDPEVFISMDADCVIHYNKGAACYISEMKPDGWEEYRPFKEKVKFYRHVNLFLPNEHVWFSDCLEYELSKEGAHERTRKNRSNEFFKIQGSYIEVEI